MMLAEFDPRYRPLLEKGELTPIEIAILWFSNSPGSKEINRLSGQLDEAARTGKLKGREVKNGRCLYAFARDGKTGGCYVSEWYITPAALSAFLKAHGAAPPPDSLLTRWLGADTQKPAERPASKKDRPSVFEQREAVALEWFAEKHRYVSHFTLAEIFDELKTRFPDEFDGLNSVQSFEKLFWRKFVGLHQEYRLDRGRRG